MHISPSDIICQVERPDPLDLFLLLNLYAAVIRFRLQALLLYRDHKREPKLLYCNPYLRY